MNEFLTTIDVLNIPQTMFVYLSPVWLISFALLPLVFVTAILTEQAKLIKGETPRYNSVIWSTVLVIFGMFLYRYIFTKIVALCEGISMAIINTGDWNAFTSIIQNTQTKYGLFQLLNMNFISFLHGLSTTLLLIVEVIFLIVRYVFLSILFIIGPVAFAFAIYEPTRLMIKAWFLSVFQVSFWIIVFRIMQAVLLSFNLASYIEGGNIFIAIAATLGFVFMAIITPAFTSKLFSGQNIGLLGSALITGGTFVTAKLGLSGAKWGLDKIGETRIGKTISVVASTSVSQLKNIPKRIATVWRPPSAKEERKR